MLLQCLTQLCRLQVNIPFTCFLLPAYCNAAIIIIIDKYSCRTLWGERVGKESSQVTWSEGRRIHTSRRRKREKKKINLHVLLVSFPFHSLNVCDIYIYNSCEWYPRDLDIVHFLAQWKDQPTSTTKFLSSLFHFFPMSGAVIKPWHSLIHSLKS